MYISSKREGQVFARLKQANYCCTYRWYVLSEFTPLLALGLFFLVKAARSNDSGSDVTVVADP